MIKNKMDIKRDQSSFRDPSGFVFQWEGSLYRQINNKYAIIYDQLMKSGLYSVLAEKGLLIPHKEVDLPIEDKYKIIKPECIPFISYPYEWSFSQLKNAALATLKIQKTCLEYGMSLKDCSAYNIQFRGSRPIFIDTLSFQEYHEGEPWVAYKQFCQHFFAPLILMKFKDIRLNQLLRIFIDGIPLDLVSSILPIHTWLSLPILSHIHLHAKSQNYYSDKPIPQKSGKVARNALLGIIDNLESYIKGLKLKAVHTEWSDYYNDTNYSKEGFQQKKDIIDDLLDRISPDELWDFGANTGIFSRIASDKGIYTVSFDIDPVAVEKNYLNSFYSNENNIVPLILDLTNPSPAIGWQHNERLSILERGPVHTVLALALIHHLAISNNVPLNMVASFFKDICEYLVIEFVDKNDSQVQRLLATREDIFKNYSKKSFESNFKKYFNIQDSYQIKNSARTIYLMKKNNL